MIGLGCVMAIYIFFSIYEQSLLESTKIAVIGFKSHILDEGKEQISSLSENLTILWKTTLLEDVSKRQNIWDGFVNSVGNDNIELVQIWDNNAIIFERNTCVNIDIDVMNFTPPNWDDGVFLIKGSDDAGIFLIGSSLIKDEDGNIIGKIKIAL